MRAQSRDPSETPLYFDHQAATPLDPAVFAAMAPYFEEFVGNAHSAEHVFGQRAYQAIESARTEMALLIGSDPEDIVFTSGATESNNLAILGIARNEAMSRDTILVSAIEHASVLEAARHSGLRVVSVAVDRQGFVDEEHLRAELTDRVRLVSIGWVNNEIGTTQDIAALGQVVRAAGALMHVDAAQALSATDLRVADMQIDYLSLSSHKAYGPKGIGSLYIAPGRARLLKPLLYGGGQERGIRPGTLPTPLCVGFGAACALLRTRGASERVRLRARRDYLWSSLRALQPEVALVGPVQQRHPGNLSIRLPVEDARDVIQLVHDRLACSSGSACHSGTELPSHVLLSTGMCVSEARQVVRLGIGRFTSDRDCDRAANLLSEAITACRG